MAVPFTTAAAYSVVPALAGYLVALALLRPAREAAEAAPAARGQALILHAVPVTGPVFALAAAVLATTSTATSLELPLLVLGIVAAVVAIVQAVIAARGFGEVAQDPTKFGILLVRVVLPETALLLTWVWAFLQINSGGPP